jgi:hypothetical protein
MSPAEPYPIREVLSAARFRDETMGTKEKFWWRDAQKLHWLFKFARTGTGEHWSEKIAAEVGSALGVPCAEVELAECEGQPGSIARSFVETGSGSLVHGNELLQEVDASYPVVQLRGVTKHTVDAVLGLLSKIEAPTSGDPRLVSAADVFTGYLLLDAVVVNSDRHHENWGVLQRAGGVRELAPSYDHASSLGRELLDAERQARLATRDAGYSVERYVRRARSGFYAEPADTKPLHPADAFFLAVARRPEAGAVWLARLEALGDDVLDKITARVPAPAISEPGRAFAHEVLRIARRMLLDWPHATEQMK